MANGKSRRERLMGSVSTDGAPRRAQASPPSAPQFLSPDQVTHHDAPEVFASAVQVSMVGNDMSVTFTAPRVAYGVVDGQTVQAFTLLPSAYVSMSIGTAKDMFLALEEVIGMYEKEFGPIQTAYSRQHVKK